MSDYALAIFGRILAENARVHGMIALNQQRQAQGLSPAYDEQAFCAIAHEMDEMARDILRNAG